MRQSSRGFVLSLRNFHDCFEAKSDSYTVLPPELRALLDQSSMARDQIAQLRVLNIDFYPRESHLITFRDPWSFPILFHPACNHLVRKHMDELAQKVVYLSTIS